MSVQDRIKSWLPTTSSRTKGTEINTEATRKYRISSFFFTYLYLDLLHLHLKRMIIFSLTTELLIFAAFFNFPLFVGYFLYKLFNLLYLSSLLSSDFFFLIDFVITTLSARSALKSLIHSIHLLYPFLDTPSLFLFTNSSLHCQPVLA